MKRKLLAGFLAMTMTAAMLVGCGSGSGGNNSADSTKEAGSSEEAETADAKESESAAEASTGDGKYTIGVSIYYYSEFITLMCEGIEEKADELGVDVVILDANNDSANQITQLENLIAQKVDALLVAAVDSDAIVPALDMAEEAGIPLVGVNMTINTDEEYWYVGPDDVLAGELEAQAAIDKIGGAGNVVILEGPIGQSAQLDRMEGNQNVLAENPDITLLANQTANWSRDEAVSIMENWLQAYPDIDAVIAHNDEMALGAIQAIEAAGKMDQITVTGVDAIKDGCNAVKEGTLLGTVYQDAKLEGGNGLQLCYDILTGNEPDQKFNLIDMTLITQDNVDTLLTTLYAD